MKKNFFALEQSLRNLKITLLLAKLDMIVSRLVSNGLIFSDDISVDIQLVTFLLLSNISELSIVAKTKKFRQPSLPVKYILHNRTSYPFSDICATLFVRSVSFFSASFFYLK